MAISNQRLISSEQGRVWFHWKDYRHPREAKSMTLEADEFIRRFLVHVLPPGFQRIRYFGFLANRYRKEKIALCRKLLTAPAAELLPPAEFCRVLLAALAPPQPRRCPNCGVGEMIPMEILPAYRWPARPPDTS